MDSNITIQHKHSEKEYQCNGLLYQDTAQFGRILPVEIWEVVADKLDNRKSLNNSSPYFRNLLASDRTLSLFQNVMDSLPERFWGNGVLSVQDILKCRQVCKVWNTGIDSFIQSACKYSKETNGVNEILKSGISSEFAQNSEDPSTNVFNFLNHFMPTHPGKLEFRNPFIRPSLVVNTKTICQYFYTDELGTELTRFLEGISTMLQKYEKHVTEFKFEWFGDWFDDKFVVSFQKWLFHMPNLIHLVLNNETEMVDRDFQDMQVFFRTTPFPTLNNLESITIQDSFAPLFNSLIERNTHISILEVKEFKKDQYDLFNLHMPNLKTLKIGFTSCWSIIPEKLNLAQAQWKLTSMSISFSNCLYVSRCNAFLAAIKTKFGNTLESFSLELSAEWESDYFDWNIYGDIEFSLTNLSKLHLSTNIPLDLDFLLTMKDNLQFISVDVQYALPETRLEIEGVFMEFYGYESGKQIMESNIWTKLTNLQELEISHGSLERKHF